MSTFSREELDCAVDDAVSLAREMDGAGLPAKLERFDLDAGDVSELVRERWESYADDLGDRSDETREAFIRAYTEGLIVGRKLPRVPVGADS